MFRANAPLSLSGVIVTIYHGRTRRGRQPPPPPVCWANKASQAIFASQSGNIKYNYIIKYYNNNIIILL
jgi:hypothetical protein